MMKKHNMIGTVILFFFFTASTVSATPTLFDWAFNINGDVYTPTGIDSGPGPGQLPGYVDYGGFDWTAGLDTITMKYSPSVADSSFVIAIFNHEFDEPINSYFNEE